MITSYDKQSDELKNTILMVLRSNMNLVIKNAENISEDLLLSLIRDPEVDFSYKTTLLETVARRMPKDILELVLEALGAEKIIDNLNGGNRYVDVTNSNEQILSALYTAKVINQYEKQADGKHYKKLRLPHS